jgi:hypothetical protein
MDNPNSSGGPAEHVVIVYAADWRDVADVRRILRTVRAGLATGWVHFKRDLETLAGVYGTRGRKGVSVWNSRNCDQISTRWLTGNSVVVTDENAAEVVAAIERQDARES